jgi:hypothetical protein
LEALGRAAREAVEKMEAIAQTEENFEEPLVRLSFISDDKYDEGMSSDREEDEFEEVEDEDMDLEALGRAAREAVEKMEAIAQTEENFEEPPVRLSRDWSQMKVAELKAELTARGLKAAGKKADLVAALEEADRLESAAFGEEGDLIELQDPDLDAEEPDFEELAQAAREAAALYNPQLVEDVGVDEEFEEEVEVEPKSTEMDFERMTVPQLKEELKARGLKVTGRKAELVERLRESS